MTHINYFEVEASNYFELGQEIGKVFSSELQDIIRYQRLEKNWKHTIRQSKPYFKAAQLSLVSCIDEISGIAEGSNIPLPELWALCIEDELDQLAFEKCTSIAVNGGRLIGHNEDWDSAASDSIVVLRRSLPHVSTLELYYLGTLGGNALTVNSYGNVQAINSLTQTDAQIGLPRNLIARHLADSKSPLEDFNAINKNQRASGFHHGLFSQSESNYSIELSATKASITVPAYPFCHTNHYLSELDEFENIDDDSTTEERLATAKKHAKTSMTKKSLQRLLEIENKDQVSGILNTNTIAQSIVDINEREIFFSLHREPEQKWQKYLWPTI